MLAFSTLSFLCLFFPLVFLLYFITPVRARKWILLAMSLLFYSWSGLKHLWLLLLSCVINYVLGRILAHPQRRFRKTIVGVGIFLNILPLAIYKFAGFFLLQFPEVFSGELSDWLLPLGLSFFTFQGIAYLVDVYRNPQEAEKNLGDFLIYMTFFPKLVSGPITPLSMMRSGIKKLSPQISEVSAGLIRFCFGLAKKVVVADVLGQVNADIWEGLSSGISPSTAWLGVLCYSLQLYVDFSSYSDMAIGLGQIFGIRLMENFNYPYYAKSITEFWRRWHISLSSWFKNYLYIPLGGSRKGNVYLNLLIVFLATGIWHGDSYTFILWGLWHGLFMLIERLVRDRNWYKRVPAAVRWLFTMLVIGFGWLLFESADLLEFNLYLKAMFGQAGYVRVQMGIGYFLDARILFSIVLAILLSFPVAPALKRFLTRASRKKPALLPVMTRLYALLLLLVSVMYIINSSYSPFLYFQF